MMGEGSNTRLPLKALLLYGNPVSTGKRSLSFLRIGHLCSSSLSLEERYLLMAAYFFEIGVKLC
jgi:hypothetical protein